jgi:hypothetical protein
MENSRFVMSFASSYSLGGETHTKLLCVGIEGHKSSMLTHAEK